MAEERPRAVRRGPWPAGPGAPAAAAMTPHEVFGILRRHILLIVALTILGLIVGGVSWHLLRRFLPRYTAMTYIEVLSPAETDPMTIGEAFVQKDIQYGHRLSVANLIKRQSSLEDLLRREEVKVTRWFQSRGSIRRAVKDLEDDFGASALRDAQFVELSMTCRDAREAALIVNQMMDLFLASQGTTSQREVSQRLVALETRREQIDREWRQAEAALSEVRAAYGLTDLERPLGRYWRHTITIRLEDLELQRNELALAISQLQANIANLERLATGPITVQIEHAIETDPVIIVLSEQISFQEAQLQGTLSKFGENHREVRQSRALIEEMKERKRLRELEIAEELRRANVANARDNLVVFQGRYEELTKMREDVSAEKERLDLARIQYDQRVKVRDERVVMLDDVKEQIEKLKMLHDDPKTPKVLSRGLAPEPLDMVTSRQWWVYFPSGTVLGFVLGIGLAFLLEMINDLVRTPRDVAKYLHVSLLGIIPDAAEDREVRDVDLCHAVRQAPYSILSESYRRFRTTFELSDAGKAKSILVGGGMAGDGTTSVAVNLSSCFVMENKKVLLIDANCRSPCLQKAFPGAGGAEKGLSNALIGRCSAKDAVRSSGVEGLDIIDAGPMPPNPSELLGGVQMVELIKELSRSYDHVVIDGPPALLVSDAKVLAKIVDATVLVFNAAATRRGAAQRTIRELQEVGATIGGCVLFGARAMKGGYFHEQFRSYQRYQKVQLAGAEA